MKLKSDADIERVARIIEADVGHTQLKAYATH